MAEYIDKDALEDAFIMLGYGKEELPIRMPQMMPAADVAPVRHGQWVLIEKSPDSDIYKCQWCGRMATKKFLYCTCGAKMDGGDPT